MANEFFAVSTKHCVVAGRACGRIVLRAAGGRVVWCGLVAVTRLLSATPAGAASAGDWPTYLGNNQRNAVSDQTLPAPLSEAWVHHAAFPPQPAWPPPANQDFYHNVFGIEPWTIHENALQVTAAGDALFYGSPMDHAVCCVEAATGRLRWKFFAEGPVRYAPTVANGNLFFGSDDGFVYALDLDGKLLWRFRIGPSGRRLPGNGHMISLWPVRTGVLIESGHGYAIAGIFPEQGIVRCAFDAETGNVLWRAGGQFYDGYLTLANDRLLVSGGRVGPYSFNLRDGSPAGGLNGRGAYIVAAGAHVICQTSQRRALSYGGVTVPAYFAVCRDALTFLHRRRDLRAVRGDDFVKFSKEKAAADEAMEAVRKILATAAQTNKEDTAAWEKANAEVERLQRRIAEAKAGVSNAIVWTKPFDSKAPVLSYSLVMAGDLLFSGRDGAVVALSAKDGAEVWTGQVTGKVYGLAVARGRLFASTDAGTIHCFMPGAEKRRGEVDLRHPAPIVSDPLLQKRVAELLQPVPDRRGYAFVLGGADAPFLCELARTTEFKIVTVESDANRAEALRRALDAQGLQGRISVHQGPFDWLPYSTYFANLVILNGPVSVPPEEVGRVLQPYGGVAVMANGGSLKAWMKGVLPAGAEFVSDSVLKRGPLPGAGEWTHQYANPANTATSLDPYVRGKVTPIWFGEPGPCEMIDRHNRTMAPLVKNGRLFIPANEKIIAVNAYNGVRLWDLPVPGSRRVGVLKDSGHMALADDAVYIVARDTCWVINPSTGKQEATLNVPQTDGPKSWGYLAVVGDGILGTVQKTNASFGVHCNMCPILEGDYRPVIVSESLFCLDRKSGATRWHYRDGPVFNSAIAAAGGRVFFLESRQQAAATNANGRIRIDHFLGGTNSLIALDLKTGTKVWEQPVTLGYQHIGYLQAAEDLVVTMGTYNKTREIPGKIQPYAHYAFHAFAADSGKPVWQTEIPTGMGPDGSHGEQWQHPVIIGSEIFTKFFACDLRTGDLLPKYEGGGPGKCGTWAASASAVFARGGGLNLDTRQEIGLTGISREGCFVNLIPACGILSVPQTAAGCTCDYPLELSVAYLPVEGLRPLAYPLHRTFAGKATVSLAPVLTGTALCYTTDGSDPTDQSPLYREPFEIDATTTVKARLCGPYAATNAVILATFTKLPSPAAAGR